MSLAVSRQPASVESIAMWQLRHHTKNALQRVIAQVGAAGLGGTKAGRALAEDLERRICLSARISDALFGLTTTPGPLAARLGDLCEATVALLSDPDQTITTELAVAECCPAALATPIVQIAHEMIGNAVKHGMHMRLVGRIALRLQGTGRSGGFTLSVSDDGWGPGDDRAGEGMPIMRSLAERHGGTVALYREKDFTIARAHFPGR